MKYFIACLIVFVVISPAFAEHQGEFGTLFGFSRFSNDNDDTLDVINVPETLYLIGFANEQFGIGPEVNITESPGGQGGLRSFGGRALFFFQDHRRSNPYLLMQSHLSILTTEYGYTDVGVALGAGLGYQWRVGSDFVFRAEGRVRAFRGFDNDITTAFSLAFGLGVKID